MAAPHRRHGTGARPPSCARTRRHGLGPRVFGLLRSPLASPWLISHIIVYTIVVDTSRRQYDSMAPVPTSKPLGCSNAKLRQLTRRVSQHYDHEMGKIGLKTTQYSLLSQVLQRGPIRPGDLAKAMTLDASTLTRNLKPLVAGGRPTGWAGTADRSHPVRLTQGGRGNAAEGERQRN